MKNINTENSKQYVKRTGQITRQRGFFSIGVGLGLSAIFALFGTTLVPEQEIIEASNQVEIQVVAANSQNMLVHPETYPRQHQF